MSKTKKQAFSLSLEKLAPDDKARIADFLASFDEHCCLKKTEKKLLFNDVLDCTVYYLDHGFSAERIVELLDYVNFGDFYLKRSDEWFALDNAAKLFPLTISDKWMASFRVSMYLKEQVVPEILQMALNFTIKRFPYFATVVKKGYFWHYLDSNVRRFEVAKEQFKPCAYQQLHTDSSPSFRIIYYQNRIAAEFFHILTDGTGGTVFVKTLVAEYLRLLGADIPCTNGVLDVNEKACATESANDFDLVQEPSGHSKLINTKALQIDGTVAKITPYRVLHFVMDSEQFLKGAKDRGVTLTALCLYYMFLATRSAIKAEKGIIAIQVPVNMRKYYNSQTLRNFCMFAVVKIPITEVVEGEALLHRIADTLKKALTFENMNNSAAGAVSLIKGIRYVPLFLKRLISISSANLGDNMFSNTLSNVGKVDMPEEMKEHIDKMDFFIGNPVNKHVGCTLVTCASKTVFTVVKSMDNSAFEEKLYELLIADGYQMTVEGSK